MVYIYKYERMHARAPSGKRTRIYIYDLSQSGWGRIYEIKTLRSNLAPQEEWGRLFKGV